MSGYLVFQNTARPEYRLVLPDGAPFPAATNIDAWNNARLLTQEELERLLGTDGAETIKKQGYWLFRVSAQLDEKVGAQFDEISKASDGEKG